MLQNGPIMLCFNSFKFVHYAPVLSYSAPTDFVYARIMLTPAYNNNRRRVFSRGGIERAGFREAIVRSAHVRRRVKQKQSALEDYVERAVMMQYTNCSHSIQFFVDYARAFFYYAPLSRYALTSYYAQNYASIICQGA